MYRVTKRLDAVSMRADAVNLLLNLCASCAVKIYCKVATKNYGCAGATQKGHVQRTIKCVRSAASRRTALGNA